MKEMTTVQITQAEALKLTRIWDYMYCEIRDWEASGKPDNHIGEDVLAIGHALLRNNMLNCNGVKIDD